MDEGMLNDLLECSVCLERLDTSSKVLPCQHTFCRKCLQDIVDTNKELRCPECRVLVECKIEDLPPNVLLMRILEGMKNAVPKKQIYSRSTHQKTHVHQNHVVSHGTPTHNSIETSERHVQKQSTPIHQVHQPYARANYDYISNQAGDLSFKKGDIIILKKRIDTHWYHGECNGKNGVFPLTYVQIMTPMVSHTPQCKALYDFRMTGDDEEGCLTFNKGEVISVIRRVDENWAEGKLDDRIGIFPLAFVELNSLARSLMKLSTNAQPGPSRVAPPTPTTEDSTPLIPTDHTHHPLPTTQATPLPTSDSSSTVSSGNSTTPNSTSNSSSSCSTAPSSPASPPTRQQSTPSRGVVTCLSHAPQPAPPRPSHRRSERREREDREKRHSFTGVNSEIAHSRDHNRHSAEILSNETEVHVTERHSSRRSVETSFPPNQISLPAVYIALYPYKPQKGDELELCKGATYLVTERCQDGWFKGTNNRTRKTGVFPGNYVAPCKLTAISYTRGSSNTKNSSPAISPRVINTNNRIDISSNNIQPPELPPRSISPGTGTATISSSWHGQPENASAVPLGRSQSAVMSNLLNSGNLATGQGSQGKSPSDKTKERKEKTTVSLMRRLTSIKRPKSPPPSNYSMDNPMFEDITVPSSTAHAVHVRSGSCPSQLLQVMPCDGSGSTRNRLFGSSSHRVKHKERPSIITSNLTYNARNSENASGGPSSSPNVNHHRKSNSLDAGKTKTHIPTERFRCIVPYPPNTEYELELQVNDIIYVHKKREDGWYKGTLQRTGKTGLFPASFVESF